MDEGIDSYTKKKAPNAYVLFTTNFVNQYKSTHGGGAHRFQGGIPRAISDPLVIQAWENLPPEERQKWKDRAREEKSRLLSEYSYRLEQYVCTVTAARESGTTADNAQSTAVNDENDPFGGGGGHNSSMDHEVAIRGETSIPTQNQTGSEALRAQSLNLRRLLRPQKKRKTFDESKYAPSFFEEISTAKQFEEKRRRERECLTSIWIWRTGEDKQAMRNESFFLVSSQSSGVYDDLHAPGTIACLEFSINDGVKREFSCTVYEGHSDGPNFGAAADMCDIDCQTRRSPVDISREIFGEWLRSTHRDLSSKTPVFFCLANEYAETFDCLSYIYAYKDGTTTRFQPYLLATMDDLFWCLLQFFKVPLSLENESSLSEEQVAGATRSVNEAFSLSRVVDQYFADLSKLNACEAHQKFISSDAVSVDGSSTSQDDAAIGQNAFDKYKRCPLAVVRSCVDYIQNWVDNGRVDDRILVASSTTAEKKATKQSKRKEKEPSSAESLKSEEMDRFSFLALSGSGGGSDRTLNSENGEGTLGGHENEMDVASDDSADVIEIKLESVVRQASVENIEPRRRDERSTDGSEQISSRPASFDIQPVASRRSFTAKETAGPSTSVVSSRGSFVKNPSVELISECHTAASEYQNVLPNSTGGLDVAAAAASSVDLTSLDQRLIFGMWTPEFRLMYESQLRLPHGCRGLGRGLPFSKLMTSDPHDY